MPGGSGKPVSTKYEEAWTPFVCRDGSIPLGEGSSGDGAGDWLLIDGEFSAFGDDPRKPKKEASLLGPGDLGVLVIVAGSVDS